MDLHYIFDPLCGWCYGASHLVHTLAQRLPPKVTLQLWPGALFPEPVSIAPGMRAHIVSSDRRIAELTGVPFGAAYLARIGDASLPVTLWSVPVIAAIAVAAPAQRLGLVEAIQRAHYVDGRDLSDMAVLSAVAVAAGLDPGAFSATMQSAAHAQATKLWISQARALMARAGVSGFPAFVADQGGTLIRIDHNNAYRHPQAMIERIEALA